MSSAAPRGAQADRAMRARANVGVPNLPPMKLQSMRSYLWRQYARYTKKFLGLELPRRCIRRGVECEELRANMGVPNLSPMKLQRMKSCTGGLAAEREELPGARRARSVAGPYTDHTEHPHPHLQTSVRLELSDNMIDRRTLKKNDELP